MKFRVLVLPALLALGLAACGGSDRDAEPPDDAPRPMFEGLQVVQYPMGPVAPANSGSPHALVLRDCTFSNTRTESCTLATLPLLGQVNSDPGIEDVMDRVLISHAWMGPRFREVLQRMPDDLRLMLRGVTAVVISSDVRPAFYWTATGAIYIDPEFIWLTPEEREVVSDIPDFRSDFGRDLQFVMPTRYVKDNRPASTFVPRGQEKPRAIEDILVDIGRLLYHELAHANDFFPPERQASAGSGRVPDAIRRPIISDDLAERHPLNSSIMRGLARVRFHGDTATAAQRAMTPAQVAREFAPDGATIFYNYSTIREDLAMLFEILLMRFHFGVDMDTAVTNNPEQPRSAADFIVEWGQRGRIGEVNVRERARYAVSRLLPEAELDAFIDSLPEPVMMRQGESWAANICLPDPCETQRFAEGLGNGRRHDTNPVRDLHGYH